MFFSLALDELLLLDVAESVAESEAKSSVCCCCCREKWSTFHGVREIRKRVRVVRLCFLVGPRLIGNLGQPGRFGAALHLPGAKPAGTL